MLQLINPDRYGEFIDDLAEMHRLRYRIFKERLGWDVQVSGDMEVDEFDACRPVYLLQRDDDGRVQGCVRLLSTAGPTMLRATRSRRSWMDRLRRRPTPSGKAAASASISAPEGRRRRAASHERPTSSSSA